MPLEDYNSWNLPFAKSFTVCANDTTDSFPTNKYLLEVDPAAFFSVIFVDTTLIEYSDERTLNYTFYG